MNARRARRTSIVLGAAAAGASLAVACVLAEPPADLPSIPRHRPLILHQQVVPPTTQILEAWPRDGFTVPIEVLDPSAVVEWHAFIDYDRITRPGFVGGAIDPDPASEASGVRILPVSLDPPADLTGCHTIEILVANSFAENHAPDSVGGDSVTWFYAPSGSLDRCPTFDAGPPLDAGVDASSEAGAPDGASE